MDGKQARRTGTGSPLGAFFDHFCDAINSGVLSTFIMMATIRASEPWQQAIMWVAPNVAFLAATWEEYHTAKFVLPVINGPNEGIFLIAVGHLITATVGKDVWHKENESLGGWTMLQVCIVVFLACGLVTLLEAVWTVVREMDRKHEAQLARARRGRRRSRRRSRIGSEDEDDDEDEDEEDDEDEGHVAGGTTAALERLFPIVILSGAAIAGSFFIPSENSIAVLTSIGMAFAEYNGRIMRAHLCKEEVRHPWVSVAVACMPGLAFALFPSGMRTILYGGVTPSDVIPGGVTHGDMPPGDMAVWGVTPGDVTVWRVTPGDVAVWGVLLVTSASCLTFGAGTSVGIADAIGMQVLTIPGPRDGASDSDSVSSTEHSRTYPIDTPPAGKRPEQLGSAGSQKYPNGQSDIFIQGSSSDKKKKKTSSTPTRSSSRRGKGSAGRASSRARQSERTPERKESPAPGGKGKGKGKGKASTPLPTTPKSSQSKSKGKAKPKVASASSTRSRRNSRTFGPASPGKGEAVGGFRRASDSAKPKTSAKKSASKRAGSRSRRR